jgi:uncharacterized membrane protein
MTLFGKTLSLEKALPWILIIGGAIGILCAAILTYDKIELLRNPSLVLNCDLDPIISCGSVIESPQAEAFGFPNTFIGLAGFPVMVTTGVILLAGMGRLKRWYWLGVQGGVLFGVGFVHWLFYQSVYNLNALCPFCMVVWVVTITMFWYVTLYNIQKGHIKLKGAALKAAGFAQRHHLDILVLWFVTIFALILKHFWYYYGEKIL